MGQITETCNIELSFINQVSRDFKISFDEVVFHFNQGHIYVFSFDGIHDYYSEIYDNPPTSKVVKDAVKRDLKLPAGSETKISQIDKNTFVQWGI